LGSASGCRNEPGPTGAQAVAWRVVQYNRGEQSCYLDVYVDNSTPLVFPEAEQGFSGSHPQLGYFLGTKDKADWIKWYNPYDVYGNTELFFIREISPSDQNSFPHKERIKGNLFRVVNRSPFTFDQHRKYAFPGLSYVAFKIGCMEVPSGKLGPVGIAVVKTDKAKYEVILPSLFLERVFKDWRVRHDIPFKCKTPKFYRHENCDNRPN
jgi:hypothetical protein